MLTQYGRTVITLSDLADKFCLKQGNVREAMYPKVLSMAEWAWKDMYRNTIWQTKKIVLSVDCGAIRLPTDCENLVNISVIDVFNQIHPLSYNGSLNTAKISCEKSQCSCTKCHGHNTLCSVIDSIQVTTEQVDIKGTSYTLTTYIRYGNDGSLQKEQIIPTWDTQASAVVMQKVITNLVTLDIDDKGCIKPTQPNITALINYLGWNGRVWDWNGWFNNNRPYWELIPYSYNYYGWWNFNAADPSIIHIFHNGPRMEGRQSQKEREEQRGDFEDKGICKVIVTYQTNGTVPGNEILVPEYAEMAMYAGILYQQKFLSPRDGDKGNMAYNAYRREKMEVFKYLNPVRMDDVIKLITEPPKW